MDDVTLAWATVIAVPICPRCDVPLMEQHCKLVCPRCGYCRDCEDG